MGDNPLSSLLLLPEPPSSRTSEMASPVGLALCSMQISSGEAQGTLFLLCQCVPHQHSPAQGREAGRAAGLPPSFREAGEGRPCWGLGGGDPELSAVLLWAPHPHQPQGDGRKQEMPVTRAWLGETERGWRGPASAPPSAPQSCRLRHPGGATCCPQRVDTPRSLCKARQWRRRLCRPRLLSQPPVSQPVSPLPHLPPRHTLRIGASERPQMDPLTPVQSQGSWASHCVVVAPLT